MHRFTKQQETNSDALVADAWLSADVHGVLLEAELISITGGTAALALPGAVNEASDNPLQKQAKIFGYAGQVGYHQPGWKVLFEHGFASGDDDVIDGTFTGRPLNPDHNVGILLYEEVLSAVTAANWTQSAQGLWSLGGVYNSRYIFPTVHVYPLDNWELKAGFVTAWPDRPDGSNIQCRSSDKRISDCATPASLQATANTLGWEVDVGLAHTWHEHLQFRLEAAAAQTTDRINTQAAGLNPEGKFFTVQSRLAWVF